MNRCKSTFRDLLRSRSCSLVLLIGICGISQATLADQLPPVTGASFDGSLISWQALENAAGYNIYLDYQYVQTVSEGTDYAPVEIGEYRIAAFDGNGNFSPLRVIDSPSSNIVVVQFIEDFLDPPQNVFGTVYSSSAGEIFWDRDNTRSLEYLITLNGDVLGTTSGDSFWMNSLPDNTENVVTVTAIDRNGVMSEASNPLLFDTRSTSYPYRAFDGFVGPQEGVVTAPQNARIEIYSSTAAELFWDRAAAAEQISTTEIYRDDELIGNSPGNSYFDNTRTPDTEYTYELIAIDVNGVRSPTTFINPGPFDGNEESDETVVQALLKGISEVTGANPHVEWFPLIQPIRFGTVPDDVVEISSENTFDEGLGIVITRTGYECSDGMITVEQSSATESFAEIIFDDCSTGGVFLSGSVDIFSSGGLFESVDYRDLIIAYDDTDISVAGNVTYSRSRSFDARTISYNSFEYYIIGNLIDEDGLDTSVVLDQTIGFDGELASYPSTFTSEFTVSAPWTLGRDLTFTTDETFQTRASVSGDYIVGSFTAESEDGGLLTLIADTGSYETWYAQLSDSNGTRGVSGVWSDMINFPCIVLNDECR